ncbi:MAG: DNA recombination protein RmuC, partial [Opitutales bacterium]
MTAKTSSSTKKTTSSTKASEDQLSKDDVAAIDQLRAVNDKIRAEIARVIIGQDEVVERMLICILSKGHGLLMGVPGLAKTLLVNSLAQISALGFSRIQFTPDLMPSDITGTDILQTDSEGRREFEFVKGPLFGNVILADEINRTPPKTQSALLEAMQEHRVTVAGPSTLLAQLNALRMGFRTLAIEKRSSEVWKVLAAVKSEFGKFGDVLAKVKKQLNTA